MPKKHSGWRNSSAKHWLREQIEEGVIDPNSIDLRDLFDNHPERFGDFEYRNFRDNARNLILSIQAKKPPPPKRQATKRRIDNMNRQSDGGKSFFEKLSL